MMENTLNICHLLLYKQLPQNLCVTVSVHQGFENSLAGSCSPSPAWLGLQHLSSRWLAHVTSKLVQEIDRRPQLFPLCVSPEGSWVSSFPGSSLLQSEWSNKEQGRNHNIFYDSTSKVTTLLLLHCTIEDKRPSLLRRPGHTSQEALGMWSKSVKHEICLFHIHLIRTPSK